MEDFFSAISMAQGALRHFTGDFGLTAFEIVKKILEDALINFLIKAIPQQRELRSLLFA